MKDRKSLSVSGAKANFASSMNEVQPLRSALRDYPLLTLGAAVAAGALVGYAGTRMLKKTGSLAAALSAPVLPLIVKKLFL